jgi:site-specific recombinase XerD
MLSPGELLNTIRPDELTLETAIRLFETEYMASRNFTPETRVHYKSDLSQLTSFLTEQGIGKPADVRLSHLTGFLAELDRRGYSGVSRRRKTASIKSFFRFLKVFDLITHNPSEQLTPPEHESKEPRFLTAQEYQALLRACSHHPRDAAIIELLLQTGIRLSEVARLSVADIELPARINRDPENTGSIYIQGKGRKSRTLPLNYKACRALKAWLSVRPDIDHPALFVTKFREPVGKQAIQRTVKKYLREAGIRNASVHTLRHTFGTHHVVKGTNLKTIQEALGHESLNTTSVYISTAKAAMRRELQGNAL